MKNLRDFDHYRMTRAAVRELWGWEGDETCGAFEIPSPIDRAMLRVIASTEGGWDHVSVSRQNRCPNWTEMEHVAALFFRADEAAMQLHVPASDHVNMHPYCLHWWRPQGIAIPRPPAIFVGVGGAPARDADDALARIKAAGLRLPTPPEPMP
jgi:hypothetical protein